MKVWLNTEIVDSHDASLGTDGWPKGSGIFETLRTENSEVFELSRHMRRALNAAERLGMKLPNEDLIREAISKILVSEPQGVGRLRLLFSEQDFLVVHQSYEDLRNPQKVCVQTESAKTQEFVMKSYPYTNRLELLANAKKNGFDELICINNKNDVTEGAVSNFAFLLDGNWVTPPLSAGVLPGVVRAIAIERCGVKVRSISLNEVANIEGALVLSSLKIALPVVSIDDRQLLIKGEAKTLEALIRAKTQKHSVG
jgi:branched-chain amino acid aminotransferase